MKTKNSNKRRIVFSIIIGIIFTLISYFGTKLLDANSGEYKPTYSFLDIIFSLIILTVSSFIAYKFIDKKFSLKKDKKFELKKYQILIPLMWITIVTFLATFPGHYPWDTQFMYEAYNTGNLNTHYSPLVCIVIGLFIDFGKFIGSVNISYAIMMILQFTFVNIVLTEAIYYCSNKLQKKSFTVFATVFFIIHPLVQALLIRSGQDTVFGGLFLLICLELLMLVEDEKNFFKKREKYVILFTLIFLLCAIRNNGIYVLIPVIISGFFILKNKTIRKKFLIAFSIPIAFSLGYKYLLIYNLVPWKDSIYRETLNVPVMQIARAMHFNPDDDIKKELEQYFCKTCVTWANTTWSWELYNKSSGISDPYKDHMYVEEIEKDPIKFFNLWAKIGYKNPVEYIEAPFVTMVSLYHPYAKYTYIDGEEEGDNNYKKMSYQWHQYVDSYYFDYYFGEINTESFIPLYQSILYGLIRKQEWSRIPVLHHLWRATFTTYLFLLSTIFALYRKKYKYLLPLSLVFGLLITVFLSPVALFRYIFPAVLCTPIMIYIFIKSIIK